MLLFFKNITFVFSPCAFGTKMLCFCMNEEREKEEEKSPNSIDNAKELLIESDPLLRRAVRLAKIREDEGAVEHAARMFFSGWHLEDAAEFTKVSERRVRDFLKTDKGKALGSSIKEELDEEFKSLYGDMIEVLRNEMKNPKAEIRLSAVNTGMRYLKDIKIVLDIGAEDLVQKIMKGEKE